MTADERRERAAARKLALDATQRELRLARELRLRVEAIVLERRLEAARDRGEAMVARRTPEARLIYERVQRWERAHPEGRPAHRLVHLALKTGKLERPERCDECGLDRRLEAHHEDYSKPLQVRWLCRSCHRRVHSSKQGAESRNRPGRGDNVANEAPRMPGEPRPRARMGGEPGRDGPEGAVEAAPGRGGLPVRRGTGCRCAGPASGAS